MTISTSPTFTSPIERQTTGTAPKESGRRRRHPIAAAAVLALSTLGVGAGSATPVAADHNVTCTNLAPTLYASSGYVYLRQGVFCGSQVHSIVSQGVINITGTAGTFPYMDGKKCTDTNACHYTLSIKDASGRQKYCAATSGSVKNHWYSFSRALNASTASCIYY